MATCSSLLDEIFGLLIGGFGTLQMAALSLILFFFSRILNINDIKTFINLPGLNQCVKNVLHGPEYQEVIQGRLFSILKNKKPKSF